jgi:hypothetical protein
VESYLKKFQTAAIEFCKKIGKQSSFFFEKRWFAAKEREKPHNRYSSEVIDALGIVMSHNVCEAMYMSLNLGFSVKTVTNIRVEHIVKHNDGRLEVRIDDERGVTKGGRFLGRGQFGEQTPFFVPESYAPRLERLMWGKQPYERILPITESAIRSG